MKTSSKLWKMKIKHVIIVVIIFIILVFMIYFALSPQDISHVTKADFFKKKKNHRISSLNSDITRSMAELSDMDKFKEILNPMLVERIPGSKGNLDVQKHIIDEMKKLNWVVSTDTFRQNTPMGEKEFTNIITVQDVNTPRKLTLACHFDSKYFKDFKFIGATDSAVPCAMLIDLARSLHNLLTTSKTKTIDVALQFLFFDGEEAFVNWDDHDSIYGAKHLAERFYNQQTEVEREVIVRELDTWDTLMLLDLIGAPNPRFLNWFPSQTGHIFRLLQQIEMALAKEGHLEPVSQFQSNRHNTYFIGGPQRGGGIQDDHIPFLHRRVPIFHMISYPFPSVWHKESDNESALDYHTIDNLNKILRVFIAVYLHL